MKKIAILFVFASVFCVNFAGIIKYQVLKPAERPLPKDVKTMVFVYRNFKFEADSITHFYNYNGKVCLDTTDYSKENAVDFYLGFRSATESHYPLDTISMQLLEAKKGNTEREIPLLDWGKVNEICQKNSADILVSLDDLSIFNNYQTWYDGDEYNGVADISYFYSCTIYDPMSESYLLKVSEMDSLQTHDTSYDLDDLVKTKLPRRDEIMQTVAFAIGEKLGKKIVPSWKIVEREYYDAGSRKFREAAKKIKAQKFQEALNILEEIEQEETGKRKARASYNLGVIYERIGKIEKALRAAKSCVALYDALSSYKDEKQKAVELLQCLEQRKKEISQLEKSLHEQ